MTLGYTITEYELPTPSGAEDYSCGSLKSGILGDIRASGPLSMASPLKIDQIRSRIPDFCRILTSNFRSYNLRPRAELGAKIRGVCSPGPLFKILGTDFFFILVCFCFIVREKMWLGPPPPSQPVFTIPPHVGGCGGEFPPTFWR